MENSPKCGQDSQCACKRMRPLASSVVWSTTLHAGPATHYGRMGHLQGLVAVALNALAVRTAYVIPHIGLSGLNHMQKFNGAASHLDHMPLHWPKIQIFDCDQPIDS